MTEKEVQNPINIIAHQYDEILTERELHVFEKVRDQLFIGMVNAATERGLKVGTSISPENLQYFMKRAVDGALVVNNLKHKKTVQGCNP
ncbi:hypothetical protein MUO14_03570 [Halobacillus shinanisalinarum]|uniref:Uncharacterized protein n=1 Tax=Halobacillus shinanisalinarum TaxID=2932258 RepID=A0ABY4H0U0_9BACI|nr:hypothetical protein [Halobacillus shinanisalinarum]UOQ94061.1 hypothetical protein MUO14_03570 [Halobacillus shinanisalinarum]